jgi:hypothetical protein
MLEGVPLHPSSAEPLHKDRLQHRLGDSACGGAAVLFCGDGSHYMKT